MKEYVSLDIGGTAIKHGIITEDGEVAEMDEMPTEAKKGGTYVLKSIRKVIEEYGRKHTFAGICVSTTGIVDDKTGVILYANDNMPGYTGLNIKEDLEAKFRIPVEVENDAACAGLAEQLNGAGRGSRVTFCLTIGTGIGGCIIIDNKVLHGFRNAAGEVGYMKMFGSDYQSIASAGALVGRVLGQKNDPDPELNGLRIFEMAGEGDMICRSAIEDMCEKIGYGIANICYVVNPEVVVLGGGIVRQKNYIYDLIRNSMDRHLIDFIGRSTRLEFAVHGNQAGMLGAYYNFISKHEGISNGGISEKYYSIN